MQTDKMVYMYQRIQYADRQDGLHTNVSNMQTDMIVYMYQRIQYADRQDCLQVPTYSICRQTRWFTCTNVSNIRTDRIVYVLMQNRVVNMYMYERVNMQADCVVTYGPGHNKRYLMVVSIKSISCFLYGV